MKKIRKIAVALALMASIIISAVSAGAEESGTNTKGDEAGAAVSAKDEVVYVKLASNGDTSGIYVVNCFDVAEAGSVTDYGDYRSVINLTDGSAIDYSDGKALFKTSEGRFYYQGDMDPETAALPWNFEISYCLDGREIDASSLGGKSGALKIVISTSANEGADTVFYDNYVLQISLTLDAASCRNIAAEGASTANSGSDKQVVFTALPGKDGEFVCEADVADFEMPGISIAAVPYSLDIETPDMSEFTDGMTELSDGIADLSDGTGEIKSGAGELDSGMWELYNGADKLKSGAGSLPEAAAALIEGSGSLAGGIGDLSDGLEQISGQGSSLIEGSASVKEGLNTISGSIQDEINGWDTISAMLAQYGIGLTYKDVAVMDVSNSTLQMIASYSGGTLTAERIIACAQMKLLSENSVNSQLLAGITQAADNYKTFDEGLKAYAGGVSKTAQGASALKSGALSLKEGISEFSSGLSGIYDGISGLMDGINSLATGCGGLYDGVSHLSDGLEEMRAETADLPDKIQEEIDKFIGEYTFGDFSPVSFTDSRNENTKLVQFVFSTDPISAPEQETAEPDVQENTGFLGRLLALFK